MDKVVYQEAVRVGRKLVLDVEEAQREFMAADNAEPLDFPRWGHAYIDLFEVKEELKRHVEFVRCLIENEGPKAFGRFMEDINVEQGEDNDEGEDEIT